MNRKPSNRHGQVVLACLLLLLPTLAVYWPVTGFEFINLDDRDYVTANRFVTQGLTWSGVWWAFQTVYAANWHPVTWLSHMLDVQLFGLHPGGPHVVNLLLHVANTLLLFLLLRRLTGALWRSTFVAALFALHPLHIESVAWISERKDVLSTCFGLLTLLAYTKYASSGRQGGKATEQPTRNPSPSGTPHRSLWYGATLLLFAFSLLSKPMLVTLPCVLLLLDYWPLQRFELSRSNPPLSTLRRLLVEKVPFLVLSGLSSVVTLTAQARAGTVVSLENTSLIERLANVSLGYVTYLEKAAWPRGLAVFYPFDRNWSPILAAGAGLLLLAVSMVAIRSARQRPWFSLGWFWFLGTLVPVIGLVQTGAQATADRYTYLPLVGLFILVAWGAPQLLSRWRYGSAACATLAVVSLAVCLRLTALQLPCWKNTEALCHQALRVTQGNYLAHAILGSTYLETGRVDAAKTQWALALQASPGFPMALSGLGGILLREGNTAEAAALFNHTLELFPQHALAHMLLAQLLANQNQLAAAVSHLQEALRTEPNNIEGHRLLAEVYATQKQARALRDEYAQMVRLAPDWPEALNNLAWLLATQPSPELRNGLQAILLAQRACELTHETNVWLLATLASAYAEAGQFSAAVATQENVCRLAAAQGLGPQAEPFQRRLDLYRSGQPYRQP
jgi:protein O-mannosyl-transferase